MGLRISTNIASLNAQRTLAGSSREMQKSFSQLSSGSRITKAADDAAGLSISENLKSHIRGYQQAARNAQDGISMVQTAEGGLGEISNILTRFRELGVQAASDSIGDDERGFINKEVQQLKDEAQRIAKSTRFGKTQLLDGSGGRFDFQVDINNDDFNDRIGFDSGEQNATTASLGVDGLDFSSKEGARSALDVLDGAQKQVNGYRANLGAIQNRLVSTTDNIGVSVENLSAANSRIRDTDIAQASADLAKNQILQTASTSVLAQANNSQQMALKLVG
ncbi:MAG: flagellin FliC [Proteobacteria bacterium]|nr:MAG: flagellin FliC [Pseudomonadota bacterium]